jgi:hypothetical protein
MRAFIPFEIAINRPARDQVSLGLFDLFSFWLSCSGGGDISETWRRCRTVWLDYVLESHWTLSRDDASWWDPDQDTD